MDVTPPFCYSESPETQSNLYPRPKREWRRRWELQQAKGTEEDFWKKVMMNFEAAHDHNSTVLSTGHTVLWPPLPPSTANTDEMTKRMDRPSVKRSPRAPFSLVVWLALHNAHAPIPIKKVFHFVEKYFPGCIVAGSRAWQCSIREQISKKSNQHLFERVQENQIVPGKKTPPLWTICEGSEHAIMDMVKNLEAQGDDVHRMGLASTDDWGEILAGAKGIAPEPEPLPSKPVEPILEEDFVDPYKEFVYVDVDDVAEFVEIPMQQEPVSCEMPHSVCQEELWMRVAH